MSENKGKGCFRKGEKGGEIRLILFYAGEVIACCAQGKTKPELSKLLQSF